MKVLCATDFPLTINFELEKAEGGHRRSSSPRGHRARAAIESDSTQNQTLHVGRVILTFR